MSEEVGKGSVKIPFKDLMLYAHAFLNDPTDLVVQTSGKQYDITDRNSIIFQLFGDQTAGLFLLST